MNLINLLLVSLALLFSTGTSMSRAQDLSQYFKDVQGAFVLYDLNNNHYIRYNEQRCRQRFSPKSTFKIPNSLIGLETGVIKDADFVIRYDSQKYPSGDWGTGYPFIHWAQDHTLRSAIKYSVVWYYRELAKGVGAERMRKYVNAFKYGDRNIKGSVDGFWLDNRLHISADEQIEFLKKFYAGKLPVSKRSTDIVKDILVLEQTPDYKLSGKTGGGSIESGKYIGWFIGYLETRGNVYFYATNIEGPTYASIRDERINLTKRILTELGYLPRQ